MVKGKKIDTKQDKVQRLAEALAELQEGESVSPTKLREIIERTSGKKMHYSTIVDTLDIADLMKDIGYIIVRDTGGKIIRIIKSSNEVDSKKNITEIRKDIIDVKSDLGEIKEVLQLNKK